MPTSGGLACTKLRCQSGAQASHWVAIAMFCMTGIDFALLLHVCMRARVYFNLHFTHWHTGDGSGDANHLMVASSTGGGGGI